MYTVYRINIFPLYIHTYMVHGTTVPCTRYRYTAYAYGEVETEVYWDKEYSLGYKTCYKVADNAFMQGKQQLFVCKVKRHCGPMLPL